MGRSSSGTVKGVEWWCGVMVEVEWEWRDVERGGGSGEVGSSLMIWKDVGELWERSACDWILVIVGGGLYRFSLPFCCIDLRRYVIP